MRSVVRRDSGERYQVYLAGLVKASGIATPTREDFARFDRKRKKKTPNTDWQNPHDPDAKITKMKNGRTHLAYKAEHAVDLETGAVVAVTLQPADRGDTTSLEETLSEALENIDVAVSDETARGTMSASLLEEVVADRGYHSEGVLRMLDEGEGIRSYLPEPKRDRRFWKGREDVQHLTYANRNRVSSARGGRLLRQRGELVERSFAHVYDTGGLRSVHLRGHSNTLKRLLIHVGAFDLGLVLRRSLGAGTPRGLRARSFAALRALIDSLCTEVELWRLIRAIDSLLKPSWIGCTVRDCSV